MFVVMEQDCRADDINAVLELLPRIGARGNPGCESLRCVIELVEVGPQLDLSYLKQLPAVSCVVDTPQQVAEACESECKDTLEIPLGTATTVGGRRLAIIAGPCSIEDNDRLLTTAQSIEARGAVALRGGAFKPRTSPFCFQGLGDKGLEILQQAKRETGLAVVTEVMSIEHIERIAAVADVLQIGSRNMHNTSLLKAVGRHTTPVLLKRGWSATLEEFLAAADYIRQAGNPHVILCERGIRTFEDYVRNTLALAVVPEIKSRSNLPVIVDPSHGTGKAHLITPMCRAAIACGADGLMIEVHPDPQKAWSDGEQTLGLDEFQKLINDIKPIAAACDREL